MVRPLPPVDDISLFRVEESDVERDLRTMLGLASPEDPEPIAPSLEPPEASLEKSQNPTEDMEPAASSHSVLSPAPKIHNPSDSPAQPSNDMQVDQLDASPIIAPPQSQTPTTSVPRANSMPATDKFSEGQLPASKPPQLHSWDPFGYVGDEEEEEEEIPSINMDSDSD